jgi:uncharacterized membrane protein
MEPDVPRADEPHPAPDTLLDVVRVAALGVVAGLRSIMPLALLAAHLEREGPDIGDGGWALDVLASRRGALGLRLAAVGEVVADKLPLLPRRVDPLPLAGRVVLGGMAGALQSLAEGRASDRGALIGSLGALVGSLLGYWLRTSLARVLPLPSVLVALGEDALAFVLGSWAVRH